LSTSGSLAGKAAVAAGAGTLVVIDQFSVLFFGVPAAAITAAFTGALIPALLLPPEPLIEAARRWLGSALFALVFTALVLLVFGLQQHYAIGVAGALASFARDLFALARGELPPIISAMRVRVFGPRHPDNGGTR
jgi:hypothetical protein